MAKGKIKTEKGPRKKKETRIAYILTDKVYGEFEVLNSANAWWVTKRKVQDLILAFKWRCKTGEACVNAGISVKQYEYFLHLHPDFSRVREACEQIQGLHIRRGIARGVKSGDKDYCLKVAERVIKDEFSPRQEHAGPGGGPIKTEVSDERKEYFDNILKANGLIKEESQDAGREDSPPQEAA